MSKFPIDWHVTCLSNSRRSLAEKERRVADMLAEVERNRHDVDFYAAQIDAARQKGLTEFDRDRLLKPRPAKVS